MNSILTETQIANLALTHCGLSKPLQALDTDRSVEAQMCRTWFGVARRSALRKIPWSFSTKQITPALTANQPTPEWLYAYQYPEDCIGITRFMSWRLNNDTRQSRVPYRVFQPVPIGLSTLLPTPTTPYASSTGLWIYTNWPGVNINLPVIMEYSFDNANIAEWTDDFSMAMSLQLASLICTVLTTGNPQQQKAAIDAALQKAMGDAESDNLNEEQRPPEPASEFIRARTGMADGYGYPGMTWTAEPAGFVIQ